MKHCVSMHTNTDNNRISALTLSILFTLALFLPKLNNNNNKPWETFLYIELEEREKIKIKFSALRMMLL